MISVSDRAIFPYLFCFLQVATNKSFTKASEVMHISQSAVSYQVKQLEDKLAVSLFERDKRSKVNLTPHGRLLEEECQDIFHSLQLTLDALKGHTLKGDVTIAGPTCFGSIVLSEMISHLRKKHPDMKTHLHLSDLHIDLRAEQIDIAFRTGATGPGLYSQPLIKVPMRLVASKDYVEEYGLPKTFDDLHEHNILITNPRDRDWHLLREQNAAVPELSQNVTYIDNVWGILHALDSGMGLSYLPLFSVNKQLQSGQYVQTLSQELRNAYMIIYLCSPYRLDDNPKVIAITEALKDLLEHGKHLGLYYWLEPLEDAPDQIRPTG